MPIPLFVKDLSEAPEGLAGHYSETERDGETIFYLDVDSEQLRTHPATKNLETAKNRMRDERNAMREKLEAAEAKLEDLPDDFDAEEWHRLKSSAGDGGDSDIQKRIDAAVEKRLEYERAKFDRERAKVEKERDDAKAAAEAARTGLRDRIRRDALAKALDDAGITKRTFRDMAESFHMPNVEAVEEDGEDLSVVYKMRDGGTIPLSEAIREWVETDGKDLVSKPTGTGANGAEGRSSGNRRLDAFLTNNLTEMGRIARENRAEYESLRKQAQAILAQRGRKSA